MLDAEAWPWRPITSTSGTPAARSCVTDIEALATELEGLGATRVSGAQSEHGSSWIVMNDPEGNEFCVCDAGQGA